MANSTYKCNSGLVFAPEERDVYSYERRSKEHAPLGAKPGSGTSSAQAKAVSLLRSEESNRGLPAINISPLMGRRASMFCCTSKLNLQMTNGKCFWSSCVLPLSLGYGFFPKSPALMIVIFDGSMCRRIAAMICSGVKALSLASSSASNLSVRPRKR
jgi:hypothetical protein